MAVMKKKTQKTLTEIYKVRCTECGEQIENKFFPLTNLLNQYHNGRQTPAKALIIKTLGTGALYGREVLPEVPPLVRKDGADYVLELPNPRSIQEIRQNIKCFECENNEIPKDQLMTVSLNISAVVAQFYLMTGFDTIYYMLQLQKEFMALKDEGEDTQEVQKQLNIYCDLFANVPGVRLTEMTLPDIRRQEIRNVLAGILECATLEADRPQERHFAVEELKVGWQYKMVNERKMPVSLVVVGQAGNYYHCASCCCDKCRRPISYLMGAYEQRIIGILGSQATGKTTYLAALTDAIDRGEAVSLTQRNGNLLHADIHIEHSLPDDPQWERVLRGADNAAGTKIGPLWMYKHGFPPEKTDVQHLEAPALSFLVSTDDRCEQTETVMYTLADIPGEAFCDPEKRLDKQFVEKLRHLLKSSSALIMVVSSRQLLSHGAGEEEEIASAAAGKSMLVRNPSTLLEGYKEFLPSNALPTAVVMTAADELDGGDLRRALHLAYDIRQCSPLVWSDQKKALVYNAEAMCCTVQAVKEYLNKHFGLFMESLDSILRASGGKSSIMLAAFAVSNGTQCSPLDYASMPAERRADAAACEKRYYQMVKARFGVAAPLLWLLACDGILKIGRGDHPYNQYPVNTQKQIQKSLKETLHN